MTVMLTELFSSPQDGGRVPVKRLPDIFRVPKYCGHRVSTCLISCHKTVQSKIKRRHML